MNGATASIRVRTQLLEVYAHAARVTKNPIYVQVVDELVGFLSREMTLPDGGFCSALDAETNAIEGEYYVWTEEQVRTILKAEGADLFLTAYGFHEPQSFEHGRVLLLNGYQAQDHAEKFYRSGQARRASTGRASRP